MIRLDDLLLATDGSLVGSAAQQVFTDFSYDSRRTAPGQLFVAVKTPRGDGHNFITEAVRAGATGVLCQKAPTEPVPATVVVVADTQVALTAYARFVLRQAQIPVIGVTGSNGKTTTKEGIAAVLGRHWRVFRNPASYNGRYGLPIALGEFEPGYQLAVLEMAADSFDEIADLARLARPRVGVVLNVHRSHMQYLGSVENVAYEKGRLVEALPADGLAVLNADDARVRAMAARSPAAVLTFGFGESADVRATDVTSSLDGTTFTVEVSERASGVASAGLQPGVHLRGGEIVHIRLLGRHQVYTALAAIAVGLFYGVTVAEAAEALAALDPLPGRLNLLSGLNGSLLLDDTNSATPESMLAALDLLAAMRAAGRRALACLGELHELGSTAGPAYEEIGRKAATTTDVLVTKGEPAAAIAHAALEAGLPADRIHAVNHNIDSARLLSAALQPGDVVLLCGDRTARLEQTVRELLAHPETDAVKLVRQEPGWERVRIGVPDRPTWVEIDLAAIGHNVSLIKERVGPEVKVLAVLKADAYGHGAIPVARTALANGAEWCGVASLNEAIRLRQAGISAPILILGYTPGWQAREAILAGVSLAVYDLDIARAYSQAAAAVRGVARVHVKVDSGLGRLGLLSDQVTPFVAALYNLPNLVVEGIFTHFAMADAADEVYTHEQLARFARVLAELRALHLEPPLIHASNSAATLAVPEARFNVVRLGIAMYGLNPSEEVPVPAGFRRALTFKTTVAQVKTLPPGSCVSYGCTYHTQGEERIAVIPVGYADGFRRGPRNWGEVLVKGRRAPIVGRVCMDQTMIQVDHIPDVAIGDEVVLIGRQGAEELTAEEVAEKLGTNHYEVVSEILARVPRVA